MSITDELRTEARGFGDYIYTSEKAHRLLAIADRIDAEHERQLEVLYRDMSDAEYVKLPKDADGVPWHRGDRVIDPKDPDGKVNTVWIAGDNTLITDDHLFIFPANELRHYHEPTVEDVLHEFVGKALCVSDVFGEDELVTEYAAKVREVLGK